jgi:hypothetical protein
MSYPVFSHIDAGSFLFHLSSILPAAQVNPRLGSVFVLDSRRFLESLIAGNAGDYQVWPSMGLYAGREYLLYHCFNDLFTIFTGSAARCPTLLRGRPHGAGPSRSSRSMPVRRPQ